MYVKNRKINLTGREVEVAMTLDNLYSFSLSQG